MSVLSLIIPAIIIITYNRPQALKLLLSSVYNAVYDGYTDIPLVISIDGGGDIETKRIAEAFDWKHGEKRIISHKENLGLRNHVISCGDLTEEYGSVIILEDDLFVSPYFFDYSSKAVIFYENENDIAGISLYAYKHNEFVNLPFIPLQNGYDVFFMQVPSSWGQIWTRNQWKPFRKFYETQPVIIDIDKLPEAVKKWPETSWKKYFYLYIVKKNMYFVYPYISYSTNLGNKGTHFHEKTSVSKVALMNVHKNIVFPKIHDMNVIYDAFMELLPECFWNIGIKKRLDFCVDFYGSKRLDLFENEYWFSSKECSSPIKQYGIDMIPIENNIIFDFSGRDFSFSKRIDFKNKIKHKTYDKICQIYNEVIYNRGFHKKIQFITRLLNLFKITKKDEK